MYDNELPNGFQDADFEMSALQAAGNRSAALAKQGVCDHGWLRVENGLTVCNHCESTFANHETAYKARVRVLYHDRNCDADNDLCDCDEIF